MKLLSTHSTPLALIGQLGNCVTEADAHKLTKELVELLGAQWFAYTTLLPSVRENGSESYLYFIGCRPELCALYSKRKWMMIDPFFEYARAHTTPIVGSQIKIRTRGQAELLDACEEYGFRSGLLVPTHTSMDANKRMGLLYIGSELPPEIGEPLLLGKRILFGALANELLLWWSNRLRRQAMSRYDLADEDIEILELAKQGKVASEIAAIFDIKLAAAYKRLNRIKEKLNVDKIDQAVAEADALGLLG